MKRNSPAAHFHQGAFLVALCYIAIGASACANLPARSSKATVSSSVLHVRSEENSRVNINTASVDELEKLPNIGRVLAERIVVHRERYGAFRRAEHLMMVQGISDNRFRKIQVLVTVD